MIDRQFARLGLGTDVSQIPNYSPNERLVGVEEGEKALTSTRSLVAMVARWQNLIPSFPWIAPGWRAWGRNPRKGRDQILQRSVAKA